jgi:hypothetical protein
MSDTLDIIDVNTWYGHDPLSAAEPTLAALRAALAAEGAAGAFAFHSMAAMLDHREGNRLTLEQLAGIPELTPVAVIPYPRCMGPADVAAVAEAGFAVLRIADTREWPLDNAVIAGMLAEAARANLLVMLELGGRGSPSQLARALGDAELDVICLLATYNIYSEVVWVMGQHPRIHLDTSKFAVAGGLADMVERFGPGRFVYGSGWPVGEMRPRTLMLRNAEIDEPTRQAIAGGNIRRLLAARNTNVAR